jgi:hypothetical protein
VNFDVNGYIFFIVFHQFQALRDLIQTGWVFHVNGKQPFSAFRSVTLNSKWKAHNPIFYPKFCLPLAQFETGWVFHVNGKQPEFQNTPNT